MSEPKPQAKEGTPAGGPSSRAKRPPRAGGGSNNGQGMRASNLKQRAGANQSGNRDSDSQASDASTKRRPGSSSRGGRGGGTSGRRISRPGSAAAPSPKITANPPMPGTSDGDSPALSNLQKVITDLKSMPASASGQNQSQSQVQSQPHTLTANQPPTQTQPPVQPAPPQPTPTYAQTTQSNLTATAPPFQPSFVPSEVPPRHRKAHSMGPTPPGNAGGGGGYGAGQYAPYLDSMSEDAETQVTEAPLAPMAQFGNRQPMGSFSAPRFSNLSSQGGMSGGNSDQEVGGSGRPQLAPSFSFGAKRRTSSMSVGPAIGEEDAGFQFPQQNQQPTHHQPQQQAYSDNNAQSNPHRRAGSEINGIMSQQIAIQNQIEALQQQQQQLLQHQLASNQVGLI